MIAGRMNCCRKGKTQEMKILTKYIFFWILELTAAFRDLEEMQCHIKRSICKNGFHRELTTNIKLKLNAHKKFPEEEEYQCFVLVREALPTGAFMDPYEVYSMNFKVFFLFPINTEQPEYEALPQVAYIFLQTLINRTMSSVIRFTFPIHFRYHRPTDKVKLDTTTVNLNIPTLMIACAEQSYDKDFVFLPCKASVDDVCAWEKVCNNVDGEILTYLPVGKINHLTAVALVTFFVSESGCGILLLLVMLTKKD